LLQGGAAPHARCRPGARPPRRRTSSAARRTRWYRWPGWRRSCASGRTRRCCGPRSGDPYGSIELVRRRPRRRPELRVRADVPEPGRGVGWIPSSAVRPRVRAGRRPAARSWACPGPTRRPSPRSSAIRVDLAPSLRRRAAANAA
jgi:hypothetical protein